MKASLFCFKKELLLFCHFFAFNDLGKLLAQPKYFHLPLDILGYYPPLNILYELLHSTLICLIHMHIYRQKDGKMREWIRGGRATPQPVIWISVFLSRGSSGGSLSTRYKRTIKGCSCHTVCTRTKKMGVACVLPQKGSKLVQLLHHTVLCWPARLPLCCTTRGHPGRREGEPHFSTLHSPVLTGVKMT